MATLFEMPPMPSGMFWDLDEAHNTWQRYVRGDILLEDAKTILVRDCGIPAEIVDKTIQKLLNP